MLKLVGTHEDGSVADEKVLIDDGGRPTAFLVALAIAELACDVAIACVIAKAVLRFKGVR